jgi:hypothetical protein
MMTDVSARTLYCSFCGKRQDEVAKLIAGPTVFICNECVDLCQHIMSGRPLEKPATTRLGRPISLVEQKRDAAAVKALAETALTYRSNEDLPPELRELADAGVVPFPDYVLLNRRDWDRLVVSAFDLLATRRFLR